MTMDGTSMLVNITEQKNLANKKIRRKTSKKFSKLIHSLKKLDYFLFSIKKNKNF
ncbi:MAG: hypothetical protein RIQ65_568 [Pseudomonadota bacterium]|jgi:hypothetical protein